MLHLIKSAFEVHAAKLAFCIGTQTYSYAEWLEYVNGIREMLLQNAIDGHFIGLAAYDDIETYAAILALWAEGYAFVPLSPQSPASRNSNILEQADSSVILTSRPPDDKLVDNPAILWLETKGRQSNGPAPDFSDLPPDRILSMLFTSGSTGIPKGVPYTCRNINSTLDAFFSLGYELTPKDRFLQMFELTFDMSMLSYLPAWCIGASVHTVSSDGIKYLEAYKVMWEQEVSFAAMVPSTLQLLKPYFKQMQLPDLRYCLVGGEPFYSDLANLWVQVVTHATVVNISGPCETTMACMGYTLDRNFTNNKSHNGVLAFGTPWKNTTVLLMDAQGEAVRDGEEGELCFGGDHVMTGYWKMPEKNALLFFEKKIDGKPFRFYRSGDMAFRDASGTYYSCGRKDIQYKIQGFKVELGDIEQHTRQFMTIGNAAAYVDKNENGLSDIHLFIDQPNTSVRDLTDYLKQHLPAYMQPRSIRLLKSLPQTISGKLDRPALESIFNGNDFDWVPDEVMAQRIADNLFDTYRVAGKCIERPVWKEGTLEAVNAYPAIWPRTFFGTPSIEQTAAIVPHIKDGTLPPRIVMLQPKEPAVLAEKLVTAGFRIMMQWPGMALDLTDKSFEKDERLIRLVDKKETLQEWLDIVNSVLFKSEALDIDVLAAMWTSGQFLFYILQDGNEVATTALGYIHNGGLGIYMVATRSAHRRKGFAKKLTLHMLQDAKDRGCRAAYLEASDMGLPMYQQIGFKQFCQFDIYWLLGVR